MVRGGCESRDFFDFAQDRLFDCAATRFACGGSAQDDILRAEQCRMDIAAIPRERKNPPAGTGRVLNGSQVIMRGRRLPLESPWGP